MQELLPFGEYVSPERAQPAQQYYMGLEAWELERILARLAVTNGTAQFGTGRRRGHTRAEPVSVNSHHAHGQLVSTCLTMHFYAPLSHFNLGLLCGTVSPYPE